MTEEVENKPETQVVPENKSQEEVSDLEKKIIRQIEYYFGDVNLPRDKFIKEKQTEDDGWITIECLTTFNRLKELSTDLAEIAAALKKSKNDLLEINDTDFKVRRDPGKPLPNIDDPLVKAKCRAKTLYMSGFPKSYTMDDIQDFFTLKLNVNTVFLKLKRDDDKEFNGSIFVELPTQEEADKLLNNKELKIDDNLLTSILRDDHFKQVDAEKKEKKGNKDGDNREPEQNNKLIKLSGAVLHFKGVGEDTSRETIKSLFGGPEFIAWVDFNRGETEGFVRFKEEGGAQKAIDTAKANNDDGKLMLNDVETEVRVLEGEEEDNYWITLEEDMAKARKSRSGRGGRGGRGGGRGGGRNRYKGDKNFKRKREWENDGDKKQDENQPKGEHKRFDEDDGDNNKNGNSEINTNTKTAVDQPAEAKKAKVEE